MTELKFKPSLLIYLRHSIDLEYFIAWARCAFGNVLKGPLRFRTVKVNKKRKQEALFIA